MRRFLVLFSLAIAAGTATFFSWREAALQSISASGRGLAQLIGTIGDAAAIVAGEPSSSSPSLPATVSGWDWSVVAVISGFIAIVAFWSSLHQLATAYDERD